jgi:ribosome recycling factor
MKIQKKSRQSTKVNHRQNRIKEDWSRNGKNKCQNYASMDIKNIDTYMNGIWRSSN